MNSKKDKDKYGRHKTKILCHPDGRKVRIDRGIASLISSMWELGIRTTGCCQAVCNFNCGHKYKSIKMKSGPDKGFIYNKPIKTKNCKNNIWIAFESITDAELLYDMVAEYSKDKDSMYEKMNCGMFVATRNDKCIRPTDHWSFIFLMDNAGVKGHWGRPKWGNKRSTREMWIEDDCKQNDFVVRPQITFPIKHLSYVEEKLKATVLKRK